jgi:hypothetical protein
MESNFWASTQGSPSTTAEALSQEPMYWGERSLLGQSWRFLVHTLPRSFQPQGLGLCLTRVSLALYAAKRPRRKAETATMGPVAGSSP